MKLCEKKKSQESVERILVPVLKAGADKHRVEENVKFCIVRANKYVHTHTYVSIYLPTFQSSISVSLSLPLSLPLSLSLSLPREGNFTDCYVQPECCVRIHRLQPTVPKILNLHFKKCQ